MKGFDFMDGNSRELLVVGSGGNSAVVECPGNEFLEALQEEAKSRNVEARIISLEEYLESYRKIRYFDLRNPMSRESFSLEYLMQIWRATDSHDDHDLPYWIIH